MLKLFRIESPLVFFGGIGALFAIIAILISIPLFVTHLETGLVPRFPTAILATGLMLLGALSVFSGLVLDNFAHGRREMKMLAYLAIGAIGHRGTPE